MYRIIKSGIPALLCASIIVACGTTPDNSGEVPTNGAAPQESSEPQTEPMNEWML